MQLGYTWEKLTHAQLTTAAADLRNAALVMKHAGYYKGALVNISDGTVCAVGAIELATYKKMLSRPTDGRLGQMQYLKNYDNFFHGQLCVDTDGPIYRSECAIITLAATVPTGLCRDCDDTVNDGCSCEEAACTGQLREPWEIVTHYNDIHCTGDVVGVNMLRIAADKAEAAAEFRRELALT